ncbi:MAG: hypothetical protein KAR37_12905, partial [Alphaproteobacteria bacterium]|nr:hypothetical protein [Alphaproteobacteria bacterium]
MHSGISKYDNTGNLAVSSAGSGIADRVVGPVGMGIAIYQQYRPVEYLRILCDGGLGIRETTSRRMGAENIRMEHEDDARAIIFQRGPESGSYPLDIGRVPCIEFLAVVTQIVVGPDHMDCREGHPAM